MKRRITEAKALLTSTDFSLTQIAEQIGFGSLAYFPNASVRSKAPDPMSTAKVPGRNPHKEPAEPIRPIAYIK